MRLGALDDEIAGVGEEPAAGLEPERVIGFEADDDVTVQTVGASDTPDQDPLSR